MNCASGQGYVKEVDMKETKGETIATTQVYKSKLSAYKALVSEQDKEIAKLKAEIEQKDKLLNAVVSTDYSGIRCHDVNGRNWFDLRRKALQSEVK